MIRMVVGIISLFVLPLLGQEEPPNSHIYLLGVCEEEVFFMQSIIYSISPESLIHSDPCCNVEQFGKELALVEKDPTGRVVFFTRDPRDALVSLYQKYAEGPVDHERFPVRKSIWHFPLSHHPAYLSMTVAERLSAMIRMGADNLLIGSLQLHATYTQALSAQKFSNVRIFRIEDLMDSTVGGDDATVLAKLTDLCTFLQVPEERIDRALHRTWGCHGPSPCDFFKEGGGSQWRSLFSGQTVEDWKNFGTWNDFLVQLGYETEINWSF